MKVNFKVKMKVTIEFLVEIYYRKDLHFLKKYFTWGNIQPTRVFLDTLSRSVVSLQQRYYDLDLESVLGSDGASTITYTLLLISLRTRFTNSD